MDSFCRTPVRISDHLDTGAGVERGVDTTPSRGLSKEAEFLSVVRVPLVKTMYRVDVRGYFKLQSKLTLLFVKIHVVESLYSLDEITVKYLDLIDFPSFISLNEFEYTNHSGTSVPYLDAEVLKSGINSGIGKVLTLKL